MDNVIADVSKLKESWTFQKRFFFVVGKLSWILIMNYEVYRHFQLFTQAEKMTIIHWCVSIYCMLKSTKIFDLNSTSN